MCADKMVDASTLSDKDKEHIDIFLRQYEILKQDMLQQMGAVKNHVRNSQIIGGALLAILSSLLTTKSYSISQDNVYLWILLMFGLTTISYYLIYDVLESVFAVKSLEAYLSSLESRINTKFGENAFIWQSKIADRLWPLTDSIKDVLPPLQYLSFYELILMVSATVVLPIYVYIAAWRTSQSSDFLLGVLIFSALYSIISAFVTIRVWLGVNQRLRARVREMVDSQWDSVQNSQI
jgi:hypothetical protein